MAQRFQILFSPGARRDLMRRRAFDQRRIVDVMELKLRIDPAVETRDKKCLKDETAPFVYTPPLWELRIGEFRAFYTVDVATSSVEVHKIALKPPTKTTAEVLNEADRY